MNRRKFLQAAALIPAGYIIKNGLFMPDVAYAQLGVFEPIASRTVNCKKGDKIGLYVWPKSTDPWENNEGESLKIQVNGKDFYRAVNHWNRPIPINFLAESDRLEVVCMVDEDTSGIRDNFADALVIIRNGSTAFSNKEKAVALQNSILFAATGVAVGGAVPALAAMGVAVSAKMSLTLQWIAGAFGLFSGEAGWIAWDPIDTNYKVVFQPVFRAPPTIPEYDGEERFSITEAGRYAAQGILKKCAKIQANLNAAYISANRAEGARAALDLYWEEIQRSKARQYLKAAAGHMAGTGQLRSHMINFRNNVPGLHFDVNQKRDNMNFILFQQSLLGLFGEHPDIKPPNPGSYATGVFEYLNTQAIGTERFDRAVKLVGSSARPPSPTGYISLPPGFQAVPLPSSIFPDMLQPMIDALPIMKQEFLS